MTSFFNSSCRYLGMLHGKGRLSAGEGAEAVGDVLFEIDGYAKGGERWANGRLNGEAAVLSRAFSLGVVTLAGADGLVVAVTLLDPEGGATAEIDVRGTFPL